MKDYYKILELPFGATSIDVKTAFRRLAFKYHPDKNINNTIAEEKFKEINEAYSILSDENKRLNYHFAYNEFLKKLYVQKNTYTPPVSPTYNANTTATSSNRKIYEEDEDGFNIVKIMQVVIIVGIVFLFFYVIFDNNNSEEKIISYELRDSSNNIIESKTLTEEEFFKILGQEFKESGDSTLLKSNLDSLKQVLDSLINSH